ncbi:MAG TPA: LPO_1073/Vpar_1526 family protein [Flavobacteriaceae bacterium]|nr:LPO_1073/Vpar_1526 family protein [Flavobacteriaceae bacterium]
MKQSTGESSKAYQAKGDINITNTGMDYKNVKQLCLELIHENFPKLQEEAMQRVNENVLAFAEQLKNEISDKKSLIDEKKLADPDVQFALNEAVQGSAKKGNKSDVNLLASLVASRIDKGNTDLLDITIEEAIRLTPKLNRNQINFLTVHHFLSGITIEKPGVTYNDLERNAIPVLKQFGNYCNLSAASLRYLAGVGVLDYNPILGHKIYELFFKKYPTLASDKEDFKEKVKSNAPSLYKLIEIYDENKFSSSSLSSFGQVIALTSLGRIFGHLDLKIWIY